MLDEELQQLGGPGEEPERDRPQLVGAGVRVARRDDVGHPLHGRADPDGVTGLDPRDHRAQAELVGAAEADVAPGALGLGALVVESGIRLDDRGLGNREDPSAGLVGDDARHGGVHDADAVGGEVARQPRHAARDEHLGIAGAQHRPGPGEPVLEVEHVGQSVARRGHTGAAGERDLAEAEVLHAGRALAAEADQHVAESARMRAVGSLGRVGRVHRRPLRQDLEVTDLGQSTLPHRTARGGQQGRRLEAGRMSIMCSIIKDATDNGPA